MTHFLGLGGEGRSAECVPLYFPSSGFPSNQYVLAWGSSHPPLRTSYALYNPPPLAVLLSADNGAAEILKKHGSIYFGCRMRRANVLVCVKPHYVEESSLTPKGTMI
jgi:hypothetical protein